MIETNIKKDIEDAELVLVGIGEQFRYNWNKIENNKRYTEIVDYIDKNPQYEILVPYLHKYLLEAEVDNELEKAYIQLADLLKGKNYFVLSTEIDDYIYRSAINPERVVTPCGGFSSLQCESNCQNKIFEFDQEIMNRINLVFEDKLDICDIDLPICPVCKKTLVMNQVGASKYCEEGYLEQWSLYTKWLQGTMNRKLLIIELGMGLQFPSIFRWPAEKLTFYNLKSKFYRIHSSLYQVSDEIANRSIGIKKEPIVWLNEQMEY